MKTKFGACLLALIGLTSGTASLAAWPDKPITLIVPAAPGGTADISARLISEKLGAALGTTVVVENRAGAAGIIGSQALTRAAPDGYTLEMGNIGPNAINYSLYRNLPYKPTDFAPVSLVVAVPNILVVNSKSPYKTVQELIDAIRNDPKGIYSFGSSGTGQSPHLSSEMLTQRAGITMTHIPFKGMGPAVSAVLAGQVTFVIDNLPSSIAFIRSGQFRALAITSEQRSPQWPDVPTLAEAGSRQPGRHRRLSTRFSRRRKRCLKRRQSATGSSKWEARPVATHRRNSRPSSTANAKTGKRLSTRPT